MHGDKHLSMRQMIILKHLAKKYNFNYRIRPVKYFAQFNASTMTIELCPAACQDDNEFLSALYHEIGHLICYRTKKFWVYHSGGHVYDGLKTKDIRTYLRTALRAERYVDELGRKMCLKAFRWVDWRYAYRDENGIAVLNEDLKELRAELARRNAR